MHRKSLTRWSNCRMRKASKRKIIMLMRTWMSCWNRRRIDVIMLIGLLVRTVCSSWKTIVKLVMITRSKRILTFLRCVLLFTSKGSKDWTGCRAKPPWLSLINKGCIKDTSLLTRLELRSNCFSWRRILLTKALKKRSLSVCWSELAIRRRKTSFFNY